MGPCIKWRKRLTGTDVRHRLAFSAAILDLLPPFEGVNWVDFPVKVRYGDELKPHMLRCVIRRTGYRKSVLETGWRQLVREKGLKQGDWLLLYVDDDDGELILEFQRSFKLFGRDIPEANITL